MGLRERKKAATRAAMSEAAAHIALNEGAEALTVAGVAEAAGVPTRTFHNYFLTREEPLFEYLETQVRAVVEQYSQIPQDIGIVDATEEMVVRGTLRDDADYLGNAGALFRLAIILKNTTHSEDRKIIRKTFRPVLEEALARHPDMTRFEASVTIHLLCTTTVEALETHLDGPRADDPQDGVDKLREAFSILRKIN